MSLRIAYFINVYPAVSHAFIRREIHALERQGFDVVRIALRGWDTPLVDAEDHDERARTQYILNGGAVALLGAVAWAAATSPIKFLQATVLALRMGWRADRPLPYHLVYLAEACRLLRWLVSHGARHVHAHFGTNSAEIVMLARALGGPPYSVTIHGPLEFDRPQFLKLAEKVRRSAFIVAITSYTRSQLFRHSDVADWPKIRVIRCGLQPEIFDYARQPPPDSARLVCIGRLVEQKGQLLLVQAAARLIERGIDFKLVLVGGGPMRSALESFISRHGIEHKVELTGAISTERLYEELQLARGLVLPSFAEGLPMVIMEAMALRRPVISTYIAGIPELVQQNETGWLVPAGSTDALAAAMAALLSCPVDRLERMGDVAYERVRELHSADSETAELGRMIRASIDDAPERLM